MRGCQLCSTMDFDQMPRNSNSCCIGPRQVPTGISSNQSRARIRFFMPVAPRRLVRRTSWPTCTSRDQSSSPAGAHRRNTFARHWSTLIRAALGSLSSGGAYVPAAAGLPNHRHATPQHRLATDLTCRYPAIETDAGCLWVDEGDGSDFGGQLHRRCFRPRSGLSPLE